LGLGFGALLIQNRLEIYLSEYYSKTFLGQENQWYTLLGKGIRLLRILPTGDDPMLHNQSSPGEKDQSAENIG
jgi:hypothetical protein